MTIAVKHSTLGNRIRAADFRDFSVAEARYAPGASLESHEHDFTYLSLVLHGEFEERVGRQVELARSASVVVMPRGVVHGECIGAPGARSVTVTLKRTLLEKAAGGRLALARWRWFHGGRVARLMFGAYREYLRADAETELGLSEFLFASLGAIEGERDAKVGSSSRCVAAAAELLRARSTRGVRLAEVADDLRKDPAYLARAFRRQMGCTMSQYRRRVWVRQAAHFLSSTEAPLSEVALKAGFADQSHLCRVFKAELGVTPHAYRALAGTR